MMRHTKDTDAATIQVLRWRGKTARWVKFATATTEAEVAAAIAEAKQSFRNVRVR